MYRCNYNCFLRLKPAAKEILDLKLVKARKKALEVIAKKKKEKRDMLRVNTLLELKLMIFDRSFYKLLTAIFVWTEGIKFTDAHLGFTNSDPLLIETFLVTFRKAFDLDESKFRALVHVHEYHNEKEIKRFWRNITKIPEYQFTKSYLKKNTGKIKRQNYKGCLTIRYYDAIIAKELKMVYNIFSQLMTGGVM